MIKSSNVVYRRDGHWFTGSITEDSLRKKKQIQKLSDVTNTEKYLTLKQWIKMNKDSVNADEYLKKLKIERLYIKMPDDINVSKSKKITKTKSVDTVPPESKEIKEQRGLTEKEWWSKYNDLCVTCKKKCKQSSHVTIIKCKREPM